MDILNKLSKMIIYLSVLIIVLWIIGEVLYGLVWLAYYASDKFGLLASIPILAIIAIIIFGMIGVATNGK